MYSASHGGPAHSSGRLPVLVAAADVRVYVQSSGSATYELELKLLNWQHLAHDAPLLASRDGGFTVMSTGRQLHALPFNGAALK